MKRGWGVLLVVCGFGAVLAFGYEASLQYYTDISELTSGCFPQAIKLEAKNSIEGIDWPEPVGEPLYGVLRFGAGDYPVFLDRREDAVHLLVDATGDGVFEPSPWASTLYDGSQLASISFNVTYSAEQRSPYQAFVIWSRFTPHVLTYCRDSYRGGTIELGGSSYPLVLFDEDSDGRYDDLEDGTLLIDADANGRLLLTSDSHEVFSLNEPFNLGGTVYEVVAVSLDGSHIEMRESENYVAPKPPLTASHPAPEIATTDSRGDDFSLFALRGSIVVLDFWASWCKPCIYELPVLEGLLEAFAAQDVRVIGINLDRSESDFRMAVKAYEISYQQLYDADDGPIADLYRIGGIPMTYVIDREGIIHARGLRGDALVETVRILLESEEPSP